MYLEKLWLTDFRSYSEAELAPAPSGITLVTGGNGEGKTNLVEAIAYLAILRSMRGNPPESLVNQSSVLGRAVVRAEGRRNGRLVRVDVEIEASGRHRAQLGGQPLRRNRDLRDGFLVTVFSPDDPLLVKGAPQGRREYLDDLLAAVDPRHHATLAEMERVLRQRNALLKSVPGASKGPNPPADIASTLDVWDSKLASAGSELADARETLVAKLVSTVSSAYRSLAVGSGPRGRDEVALSYQRSWSGDLAEALSRARTDDLRRGVTTVGPHRDDLALCIGGTPARTHASQGEQRSLALALRLGGHALVTATAGSPPILLLDDVFSELDASRADALLGCLPDGQAIVTTASSLPPAAEARVAGGYHVQDGRVLPCSQ